MPVETPKRGISGFLRGKKSRKWRVGIIAAAVAGALAVPVGTSLAETSAEAINFEVPFPCKQSWEGQTRTDHSPANSIDFNRANDYKDPVVSSAAGTVSKVADLGGDSYGKYVVVDHGGGWQTYYAHLYSFGVKQGDKVKAGSRIGLLGTTGGSTGPHLHYEQRLNGSDVKAKFDGRAAHYWGSKTYKSGNCGGGSGNPYSAEQVCGSGYGEVDSKALRSGDKRVGSVHLLYSGSTKKNCVVTLKNTGLGKKSATSATLAVKDGPKGSDSGKFTYYAGPVKAKAAKTCVKWGGSVGDKKFTSDWGHCG